MKNSFKKLLCGALSAVLLTGLFPTAVHASTPFTDIHSDAWYSDYVDYVYANDLMAGTSGEKFSPNMLMTRAMLVTVIHRMAGNPASSGYNPFWDVSSDSYFSNAVIWCHDKGIVAGTSANTFSPNATVSREQMVTIMHRFAEINDADSGKRADLSGYSDSSRIENYAADSFQWAVANKIMQGTSSDKLAPKSGTSRAQCSVVLQRYCEMLSNKPAPEPPAPTSPTVPEPTAPAPEPTTPSYPMPSEPIPTNPQPPMTAPDDKTFPYEDQNEDFKREAAKWTIYYINEYRKAEGKAPAEQLPGLTLVTEYRADQLTINFDHDVTDKRNALAYYKYGRYVDVTGLPGWDPSESYYEIDGQEAIGCGGGSEDAQYLGYINATACFRSSGHWAYVGNPENKYIGVGIEFDSIGRDTCCIMVTSTNHDIGWVNPHQ